jgi:hypothetical protein
VPFTDGEVDALFTAMSTRIQDIHVAETAAIKELSEALME